MIKDYRNNYFKIYFWQAISVLLGLAALFVVVPYISSNKTIYGIYSVCISLTIFFSYADLGFLSSGIKYAAESYVKGDHHGEVRIIGFTSFIMVSVFAILAIGIIVLGFFPKLLIPELIDGSTQMHIARCLLFTLAISCPVIIGQRLLNLIFTIRVEDYKFQRLIIVGNIIRIAAVFLFFGGGRYMIVEYYIFYQLVNLVVVIAALLYAHNHYGYSLRDLFSSFRFDRDVFDKVRGLTGASLIMMLSSVIYYEFDQVIISNVIGIEAVAVYAVAFSVLQLVRSFCSIVYSPYNSRYNHYVGLNNLLGLTHFVNKMIILFAPIIIIPILTLSLMAKPFVISWVGEQYSNSAMLVSFLVLSFVFNFISQPISQYFVSTERNRILIRYSILVPITFWIGVTLLIGKIGVESFAVMKFVAPIVMVVAYWILANKDFKNRGFKFIGIDSLLKTVVPTVVFVFVSSWLFGRWMIEEHTKAALLVNILLMGASVFLSLGLAIPFNTEMRVETSRYIKVFAGKIKKWFDI
ncbi:MAG: lipopolysaccharide biosynthesis protein [Bacteroidales bacterium]|nr:lipopolysaccharide biosynthesis protein [Bacteroidales bacterium]